MSIINKKNTINSINIQFNNFYTYKNAINDSNNEFPINFTNKLEKNHNDQLIL